jgi:formate hydrogenlyase subunit 6/NADH:ubiquinone oxidoreductase subunit I
VTQRGLTQKTRTEHRIVLERAMVTRHYIMTWDLDRCVGCQIGPLACPKDAVVRFEGEIVDGRLAKRPWIDINGEKCVLCGICEIMCPMKAITLTVNGTPENPVLTYGAFPELVQSTRFDKERFDWSRKDFVIENCPTKVISSDEARETLTVDQDHCIHCRQCEVGSNGAFEVVQPWEGRVVLHPERCVAGCLACADICPTRALHIDDEGKLALADYYCIKCGACMEVCPVKPEYESYEVSFESYGVTRTVVHQRMTGVEDLPIRVERWRIHHTPVQSAAWIEALDKMADDKAAQTEIDRKRALKRRDLLKALVGGRTLLKE